MQSATSQDDHVKRNIMHGLYRYGALHGGLWPPELRYNHVTIAFKINYYKTNKTYSIKHHSICLKVTVGGTFNFFHTF